MAPSNRLHGRIGRHRPRLVLVGLAALAGACGSGNETQTTASPESRAEIRESSSAYVAESAETLRGDAEAMALAGRLFAVHCADCHGANGRGTRGVTDLTRGRFAYGTTAAAIRTTIRDGRQSEMPGMGREYGEVELGQIVAFVETLGGDTPALSDYEARGREFYLESCAACHGENGRGQPALGAPDLADDYWQHGDSMMNVRLAITRGTTSECPPHGELLTPAEIELLTAYVLNLTES